MADEFRTLVSVKLAPVGRVHIFLLPQPALDDPLVLGDQVVVEGDGGADVGRVVGTIPDVASRRITNARPLPKVVRRATNDDLAARRAREQRERAAFQFCLLKVRERNLPMKLARVEQLPDGSRLVFYFTAEGRVDFRELVRDLAAEFRVRVEMRQIGVRDEAKLLGGYGSCGRPLCCTTWLQAFEPVSIKMAKQQHLSLNPSKLSGLCGRLKCCLRYELPNAKGETFAGCAHERSCAGRCGGSCAGGGSCGGCQQPR
jgi:cell fate regulator YaaT (PSP1 superfamily)